VKRRLIGLAAALLFLRFVPAWWCGAGAHGDHARLAEGLISFELRQHEKSENRFVGEWALVTHQMIALGLAQLVLAHPDLQPRYGLVITQAALRSFLPEMRDFGTRAWREDALDTLASDHGHAYLAYSALAVSMARRLDPAFPRRVALQHDALIAAYERRLLASKTGLIETYPGEAYPTDVAAVAAAIAVHGRATGTSHAAVLAHWAKGVRELQIDKKSGLVIQRMDARTGAAHDAPRGSGTGLAAYFAGFADRSIAQLLADGLWRHRSTFFGFGAIREYADGYRGHGDVDSGPVVFGVSVAATGFALAPAHAFGHADALTSLYRTVDLFGLPVGDRFATGGAIGNALLLAMLTSGPELAP
jgi:hypothetical protein